MYSAIKDEIVFDKYMKIWEKVINVTKKINSEIIYIKKYLKAKEYSTQKKAFNDFIYQ